jgi:hypothetical protein
VPPWAPASPAPRRRHRLAAAAALVTALVAVLVAALAVAIPVIRDPTGDTTRAAGAAVPGTTSVPLPDAPGRSAVEVSRTLLAGMTRAVTGGDHDAFTSFAAWGHPTAKDHLADVYSGLHALPLASFELAADTTDSDLRADLPAPDRFTLSAVASYRLAGWDDVPVRVPLRFVVGRSNGAWGIVEDRTADDAHTAKRLEPWLFPRLQATSTAHVLVLGERSHAAQLRRLARTLEALVGDVRRVWPGGTWNGRVVAYATTATPFVRSWYGRSAAGDSGNGDRAAFVAKVATLGRPGEPGGAVRMVLTPYLLQGDRPGYADILRHELTHVAVARLSAGVPVWLVEGAAEYTGFARRTASGALDATTTFGHHGLTRAEVTGTLSGTWRPTLAAGTEFYGGSESSVDEHYNSAFITCLYIADRYGEKTLRRLYERAARLAGHSPLAAALVATTERAALREVLRTDHARLARDVGAFAARLRHRLVFR